MPVLSTKMEFFDRLDKAYNRLLVMYLDLYSPEEEEAQRLNGKAAAVSASRHSWEREVILSGGSVENYKDILRRCSTIFATLGGPTAEGGVQGIDLVFSYLRETEFTD